MFWVINEIEIANMMIRNESKKMGLKSEILEVGFCGLLEFIMKQNIL